MRTNLKALFKGKDKPKEELAEANALKPGRITPAQYAKGETMEDAMKKKPTAFAKKKK